jgi:hypothetical protein
MKQLFVAVAVILAAAGAVHGQVHTGSITGTVKDEQGAVVPGVTVTLHGDDATRPLPTNDKGQYRFLNLAPGNYRVTAAGENLSGNGEATVSVGRNTELSITVQVIGGASVVVQGEIVDRRATGTATNLTRADIDNIPNSRDFFAYVRAVAGGLSDQVNVGGNETGQQPAVVGKGGRGQDTVYAVDGVDITDMGAPGFSPVYFIQDAFDEIQISTSGHDIRSRTGGVNINLITKRGTNEVRGGFKSFFSNDRLEASNVPGELLQAGVKEHEADHTVRNADYSFDLGGPILKDRLWFYAAMAQQDIQIFRRTTAATDKTKLRNPQVKVNWQANEQSMVNFLFINGYKLKSGRNNPANGTTFEEFEATHHQDNAYSDGPLHGLWKIGLDRVFGTSTFLSTKYASFNTGIKLTPEGGTDAQAGRILDVPTRAYGSTVETLQVRPQHSVTADIDHFPTLFGFTHNLKGGFGFRHVRNQVKVAWPGNGIVAIRQTGSTVGTQPRAQVYREVDGANIVKYLDFYAGDRIDLRNLTIDFGVRYDRQWGEALPSTAPGNPALPDVVPGVNFAGYEAPFIWNTLSPRASLTYLLTSDAKTVARASYSRFAGQLAPSTVGAMNPTTGTTPGNATYKWTDLNADAFAQASELDLGTRIATAGGFNAADPTAVTSANLIDANLKAPVTQTVVLGIERQLVRNTVLTFDYSYNRTSNLFGNMTANITPRVGTSLETYIPGDVLTGTLPDGTPYSVQTYKLNLPSLPSGNITRTVPGYYTDYHGLELNAIRRFANRWMGRVMVSYNNAREHFTDPLGVYNTNGNPTPTPSEPLVNGGQFAPTTQIAAGAFLNAKWQFNANAMYVGPYDIEFAGNIFGRQGYPFVIYRGGVALGVETNQNVLVTPRIDTFRLDNVWTTDLRVARAFRLPAMSSNVKLMLDVFNLFNANTELARVGNQGAAGTATNFNTLTKNLSPRIARLGLAIGF